MSWAEIPDYDSTWKSKPISTPYCDPRWVTHPWHRADAGSLSNWCFFLQLSSITAFITFDSLSSWSSTWWWWWWSNQHQHDHHDHHQHQQQQHNNLSCFRTVQWCLWQLWATLGNPLHLTLVLTLLLTQKLAIWISAATFTNNLLEHHCVLKQWFCSHWIRRTGASDFYKSSTVGWAGTKLAAGSLNQTVFTNLGNVGETSSFVKQKCL